MVEEAMKRKFHVNRMDAGGFDVRPLQIARMTPISYNGVTRPLVQLPPMIAPFGVSKFVGPFGENYSLTVNTPHGNDNIKSIFQSLQRLITLQFPEEECVPIIKSNGKFADSLRFEMKVDNGRYVGMALDHDKQQISAPMGQLMATSGKVTCLIELGGVWHSKNSKCGLNMQLVQFMIHQPPTIESSDEAFMMVDEPELQLKHQAPTIEPPTIESSGEAFVMVDEPELQLKRQAPTIEPSTVGSNGKAFMMIDQPELQLEHQPPTVEPPVRCGSSLCTQNKADCDS